MRNDDLNRTTVTGPGRERGTGPMILGILAVLVVLGLLFMWAPWSKNHTADSSSPGTTVGSSTNRPAAPASPTTTTPSAPSPNR
jgi:hypothetical protein